MKEKYIIFDFDGTLANSLDINVEVAKQILNSPTINSLSSSDIESLKTLTIKELTKKLNIPLYKIPYLINKIRKETTTKSHLLRPFEDIKPLIHELIARKYILGILSSNSKKNIELFLQNNHLNRFSFISAGANLLSKEKKMSRLKQKYALNRENSLYIGDEIKDIQAANNTDIPIIAVTWGYNSKKSLQKYKPTYIVDTVKELRDILLTQ